MRFDLDSTINANWCQNPFFIKTPNGFLGAAQALSCLFDGQQHLRFVHKGYALSPAGLGSDNPRVRPELIIFWLAYRAIGPHNDIFLLIVGAFRFRAIKKLRNYFVANFFVAEPQTGVGPPMKKYEAMLYQTLKSSVLCSAAAGALYAQSGQVQVTKGLTVTERQGDGVQNELPRPPITHFSIRVVDAQGNSNSTNKR